jgi:hypothetical protein
MNEMPLSWRLFRALCIVQLILIALPLVSHVAKLFSGKNIAAHLISTGCYTLIFIFVYQGVSLMNYNYPDTPLSMAQKRRFNLLYLGNFLLIAFMFSKVVDYWWIANIIVGGGLIKWNIAFWLLLWFLVAVISFIFHLLFLYGMYSLRKLIYKNTITKWVNQFDQQEP